MVRSCVNLRLGPIDALLTRSLAGYRRKAVAHWGIVGWDEADLGFREPTIGHVVSEVERMNRRIV